jgi:16S rRNA (guanine527-N7)-methyltransferase
MNILDSRAVKYCAEIGLSPKVVGLIERYLVELKKANEKCNLIGRLQDNERICHYHVIDCLLPLKYWPDNLASVYDIGTGAGFPGLLWAIIYPKINFYLVDKSPKKCSFLTRVVSELQLTNIQVINQRCDVVEGQASLVVSRAMTSTHDFLSKTLQLSSGQTQWWLMKALRSSIEEELSSVDYSQWVVDVKLLEHPTQDVTRHLVCINRVS